MNKERSYLRPIIERRIRELEKRCEEKANSTLIQLRGARRTYDDYRRDEITTLRAVLQSWDDEG